MQEPVIFNFWRSTDNGENWTVLDLHEVPEEIQKDDCVERLLDGEGAEHKGVVYIAIKMENLH